MVSVWVGTERYNIEGVTSTIESKSYADAVHQPGQIKEFAKDPIVSSVSAIKSSGFSGRDALTLQDWRLPGLSTTDMVENSISPTIKLIGIAMGMRRTGVNYEAPGVDYLNKNRDGKTRLTIPQSKTIKAAARLNWMARKKYPTLF